MINEGTKSNFRKTEEAFIVSGKIDAVDKD